jgi:hypothetical protein
MGFEGGEVTMGLEERDREEKKSGAVGAGVWLRALSGAGVAAREVEGGRGMDVSIRRMGAGR